MTVSSSDGEVYELNTGESLRVGDFVYLYAGNEGEDVASAVFEKWEGQERRDILRLKAGSRLENYTLKEISSKEATGLQAVVDPGFAPVMAGLIILALGLFLTYYQKLREKES
ncbi:MAG: hypothetical protein E4H36_08105 [Spirochaetales bacterium]|nr:MAG: hypothetical protein E4H36_08105 [Spirochaetales bacterium]